MKKGNRELTPIVTLDQTERRRKSITVKVNVLKFQAKFLRNFDSSISAGNA